MTTRGNIALHKSDKAGLELFQRDMNLGPGFVRLVDCDGFLLACPGVKEIRYGIRGCYVELERECCLCSIVEYEYVIFQRIIGAD